MSYTLLSLQLLLMLSIYYFISIKSYYTTLFNLTLFLIIKGLQLLYIGGDLFTGFLWVVDFNLLFLFLLFGIYYMKLLQNSNYYQITHTYTVMIIFIIIFLIYIVFNLYPHTNKVEYNMYFISNKLVYLNIYTMFFIQYLSNLYILYFLYFKINVLEFLLINIILFMGIIIVIYLIFTQHLFALINFFYNKKLNINYFLKTQISTKQRYTKNVIFKVL